MTTDIPISVADEARQGLELVKKWRADETEETWNELDTHIFNTYERLANRVLELEDAAPSIIGLMEHGWACGDGQRNRNACDCGHERLVELLLAPTPSNTEGHEHKCKHDTDACAGGVPCRCECGATLDSFEEWSQ